MGDEQRERDEALLRLLEGVIRSNIELAQEVRQLRETIHKAAGGNLMVDLLKTLGVRRGGR